MDPVSSTSSSAAATLTSQADQSVADGAKNLSSDFETFLRMLTAQIQHQDPLNPMDSADFAVQLATFSGVEQQVQTNDLLETMSANSSGAGLAQYAGWVGMEARHSGPVEFSGSPVDVTYDLPLNTEKAELVVRSESGIEIQRVDITGRKSPLEWAGLGSDGTPLLSGRYQLEVASQSRTGLVETQPVQSYARVSEAQTGPEGPILILDNGISVNAETVTALRAP